MASELVPRPARGRLHRSSAVVRVTDVSPDGRARLDACARWLQDAAIDDVIDAGLEEYRAWLVRRTRIELARAPVLGAAIEVTTWCSGVGALWAERRTSVADGEGVCAEAVALWVHVDPATGRPRKPGDAFFAVYGEAAGDRRVKARLCHPGPPPGAPRWPWFFRAADLDPMGHVNNTVYWQLAAEEHAAGPLVAEVEHSAPAGAGPAEIAVAGSLRWVLAGEPAAVCASILVEAGQI